MSLLDTTFGVMLLGVLSTSVVYGITNVQTYFYYRNYSKDPRGYKWMVAALWVLDTSHLSLSWHMIYYYLVDNFSNIPALADLVWSFASTVVLTCVTTAIVHIFYARKVWILSGGSYLLVGFILLMSLCRVVFGLALTVFILQLSSWETFGQRHSILPFGATGLSAGALADLAITVYMCYFFNKSRTGFRSTNHLINKLIIYTVNSGALTTIFGVLVIVTFIATPRGFNFLAIHLILGKLYSNAALASLNTRISLRGIGIDEETTDYHAPLTRPRDSLKTDPSKVIQLVHPLTATTADERNLECRPREA